MIQFNLLPDIKVEFNKTRRLKRSLIGASFLALGVAVVLVIATFSMTVAQKRHIGNLDKDIVRLETEIKDTEDLDRKLTVQNQLNSLPALFDGRPAVSRLPVYIDQVTPVGVELTDLTYDFALNTIEYEGKSQGFDLINKFVDALKFTTFSVEGGDSNLRAFKDVIYSDFGRDDKAASFTIKMTYDPAIFDQTKKVSLNVPSGITTRSQITTPLPNLFNAPIEEPVQ
jgi:Tfp pilus assembly protein PilN